MLSCCCLFLSEFGHVNVSRKYKKDPQLGIWVSNLKYKKKEFDKAKAEDSGSKRSRKSSALLDRDKIRRLESIGFNFETRDVNIIPWEERLQSLKEYHEQNGTFRVPRRHGSLGEWVHKQRQLYNKRDEKFMETRYPKLEAIGFEFTTNRSDNKPWDHRLEELVGEKFISASSVCGCFGARHSVHRLIFFNSLPRSFSQPTRILSYPRSFRRALPSIRGGMRRERSRDGAIPTAQMGEQTACRVQGVCQWSE